MKTLFTSFWFFLPSIFLAQITIPSPMGDIYTGPCPFNSSENIWQVDGWEYYQTLDDRWDGPIDSSICISLDKLSGTNRTILPLSEININKPLFIRTKFDMSSARNLMSNDLYSFYSSFSVVNAEINTSVDCPNDMCSGGQLFISIPNEDSTSDQLRLYKKRYESLGRSYYFETCLPTEYFSNNRLADIVLKISFSNVDQANAYVQYLTSIVDEVYEHDFVSDTVYARGSNANNLLFDFSSSRAYNLILKYKEVNGYPKPGNESSTIVIPPIGFRDQQQTINVLIDFPLTLIPQPFTQFLGSQVEGQDSIRHKINFVNNGGDLCFTIVDFVFENGNHFIHKKGQIEFSDHFSCLQFRYGSNLIVADDSHLELGAGGHGFLALRQGGGIVIGKNSTLTIDNNIIMNERFTNKSQQIYMELNEGSVLRFGPNATISNRYSIDEEMKLNIYMKGGTLDDHHLSSEERQLINKIYPKPSLRFKENIHLFPNPTSGELAIRFLTDQVRELKLSLHTQDGNQLTITRFQVQKGIVTYPLSWKLEPGIYFVVINDGENISTEKLVVVK